MARPLHMNNEVWTRAGELRRRSRQTRITPGSSPAVTFLSLLSSAGIGATRAVLVLPLEHEFGWDRATISLALSINLLLFGLCGPFAGAIMARFGVRRVMLTALVTLAVAVSLSTLMQSAWQLVLLWGVVVGLGSGAMALVLGATVAARWFVRRRGLVTGLFAASTATGQLVFLPLQAAIIESVGWRTAVLLVAGVAVAGRRRVVGMFMRDDPQPGRPAGLRRRGRAEVARRVVPAGRAVGQPVQAGDSDAGRRARIPDFWFLAGSFAICGATTVGLISVHLIPASVEHGLTEVTAASMLAAMGIFDLVGTTASGWLSDRIDPRKLLVWYYTLARAGAAVSAGRVPARACRRWPGSSSSTAWTGWPPCRRRSSWSASASARSASGRSSAGSSPPISWAARRRPSAPGSSTPGWATTWWPSWPPAR